MPTIVDVNLSDSLEENKPTRKNHISTLTNVNFSTQHLDKMELRDSNLHKICFKETNLIETDFARSIFDECSFEDADCQSTTFIDGTFLKCIFVNTSL
ncbi:MAG: pentapeptide repeat-containing protein, partial [Candidatus Hodarchaeales archaeon]